MIAVGLIYGSRFEDIPHIAPLMAILSLPLFVTDTEIYHKIQRFFPGVSVQQVSPNQLGKTLLSTTNTLISCLSTTKIRHLFGLEERIAKRQLQTIFLPHSYLEPLTKEILTEKHLFFFGPKMSDELYALSEKIPFKNLICIGNYRYLYAKEHPISFDQCDEMLSFVDTLHFENPVQKESIFYIFTPYTSLEEIQKIIIPRLQEIAALDNFYF